MVCIVHGSFMYGVHINKLNKVVELRGADSQGSVLILFFILTTPILKKNRLWLRAYIWQCVHYGVTAFKSK